MINEAEDPRLKTKERKILTNVFINDNRPPSDKTFCKNQQNLT